MPNAFHSLFHVMLTLCEVDLSGGLLLELGKLGSEKLSSLPEVIRVSSQAQVHLTANLMLITI